MLQPVRAAAYDFVIVPADKYPQVVIPAKAGIQKSAGYRIKSGMTGLAIWSIG